MRLYQYTQDVKEKSRRELWERAVNALTKERRKSRVLDPEFAVRLWDFSFDETLIRLGIVDFADRRYLDSWLNFADSTYGTREASELRIAYFCGPEPENDLAVLQALGVRIENIWAFENHRPSYQSALAQAKIRFPILKIYPGSFESFLEVSATPFDIIYLDFTAPLFSRSSRPYSAIHAVFDYQALTELGVLILTTAEPDQGDEEVSFLSDYFFAQDFVEGGVFGQKTKDGEPIDWFIEGADAYGYHEESLRPVIRRNFPAAYSGFATQYPLMYANFVQPFLRILRIPQARKRFFSDEEVVKGVSLAERDIDDLETEQGWEPGGDLIFSPGDYPLWNFVRNLGTEPTRLGASWRDYYMKRERGYSRWDAIRIGDLLRSSMEGYSQIFSQVLRESLREIYRALPDREGGVFCDVPFPGLWAEVGAYQLGFPHHPNVDQIWRARYTAKTRTMLNDLFVLDRCRAFYDWLPMIELFGEDLRRPERQMMARICLNCIGRHRRWILPQMYFATALIGYYEEPWARYATLAPRVELA